MPYTLMFVYNYLNLVFYIGFYTFIWLVFSPLVKLLTTRDTEVALIDNVYFMKRTEILLILYNCFDRPVSRDIFRIQEAMGGGGVLQRHTAAC